MLCNSQGHASTSIGQLALASPELNRRSDLTPDELLVDARINCGTYWAIFPGGPWLLLT